MSGLELGVVVAALLIAGPLTILGARFAKRNRGMAFAATSLLLIFGLNFNVDPPPPPRLEMEDREDEAEADDEPK